MEIRHLTETFAVSPQIEPSDVAAIVEAGFKTVTCNRPDAEVDQALSATAVREAVEAAGLTWAENAFSGNAMTLDHVQTQGRLTAESDGPVLAYCRSGTRSATAWAYSQAGVMPTDDILAATARGGYDFSGMGPQIDALAAHLKGQ